MCRGEGEGERERERGSLGSHARPCVVRSHPREIMGTVRSPFLPTRSRGRTHCSPIDDREIRKALLAIDYATPFPPRVVERLVCHRRKKLCHRFVRSLLHHHYYYYYYYFVFLYRFMLSHRFRNHEPADSFPSAKLPTLRFGSIARKIAYFYCDSEVRQFPIRSFHPFYSLNPFSHLSFANIK